MKVLVNGGINISELDGWWAEAYTSDVGWALGDGREHGDDPYWDAAEAERLYEILEREVVPEFTSAMRTAFPKRGSRGCGRAWRFLLLASRRVEPYASTRRSTISPRWRRTRTRAQKGALGAEIVAWQKTLEPAVARASLRRREGENRPAEAPSRGASGTLSGWTRTLVRVELFADGVGNRPAVQIELTRVRQMAARAYVYGASVPATRPAADYTPRVVPHLPKAMVPLEARHILWQK